MAAVSYTSIPKRSRRSLDFLLVFSCPMQGDRKILSWEYAQNSHTADWVMNNLEENQCLVFETSRKVQRLFVWKSQLLLPEDFRGKSGRKSLPALEKSGTARGRGDASDTRWASHRRGTTSVETKLNFRDSRKVPTRQKEQARPSFYRPSPEVLTEIQKKLRFRANGGVPNSGVKPMLPVGEP